MASAGGIWAPIAQRVLRKALSSTAKLSQALRTKLSTIGRAEVQPIPIRTSQSAGRPQPIHHLAFLRQNKAGTKWYSTGPAGVDLHASLRRFLSTGSRTGPRFDRSSILKSNIASRAVWQTTGRAPFSSTLRPNLTGGALPRTAGGYSMPGRSGARYFSHTPAAPAQVVQNVSQAFRAFWLSGQRARFDGLGPNGERRYCAVSALQEEKGRLLKVIPKHSLGSFVDFRLGPTITALSPLTAGSAFGGPTAEVATTLGDEGFLDILSVDFARAVKEMSAVMNDIKRLASLGDLPILLEKGGLLRVRFPGVDADTVMRLCDDLGVSRGVIGQDVEFELSMGIPVALKFPFAPDAERAITSPGGSLRSRLSEDSSDMEDDIFAHQFIEDNPWLASLPSEGYGSMSPPLPSSGEHCSEDFEGLEGIYRFLEECDRAKPRF